MDGNPTGVETWTPQQDLGDSSSDGAGATPVPALPLDSGLATFTVRGQPFSLSLPRDAHDKVI